MKINATKTKTRNFSIFLTFSLGLGSVSLADDWGQWRGPNRNGIVTEKNWNAQWPAEGLKKLWEANGGVGLSSFTVSEGKVFTMGNREGTDCVICYDAETGKLLWEHQYPCDPKDPNGYPGTRVTPTVDGTRVYTVSRLGQMFCLNKADGKPIWQNDFAKDFAAPVPTPGTKAWWGYAGSPLIEGNLAIVETGAPGASLVALDKATGKVIWKSGDDKAGYSSPFAYTYKGERCVAMFSADGIVGRSIKDGKELWRSKWKTSWNVNAATPVIDNGRVFISSGYNTGCALVDFSENPAKVVWQNKNMRNHVCTCVLWNGYLYGFDEKELRCLDWNTGEVKWTQQGFGKGCLFIADGKLVIYSDNGLLALAQPSPESFKEICRAPALGGKDTWAMPVLANGRLYCRTGERVICFDLKK